MPPGSLEIRFVPRLAASRRRLQPGPRRGEEFARRHHRIDEFQRLCPRRRELLAAEQHLQRLLGAGHPRHPLRAAGAGEKPDPHFRETELDAVALGDDPAVAGEGEFERSAERGAVDRRDDRLAAGLEFAEHVAEPPRLGIEALQRSFVVTAGPGLRVKGPEQRVEHGEVGAAGKRLLAGGEDHALDRGVGSDPRHDRLELGDGRHVEDVHRPADHVPGDGGDAVLCDLGAEIGAGHRDALD